MRINKLVIISVITIFFVLISFQSVFADRFWDLYQLGKSRKNNGNMIEAIDAWKQIVELYNDDTSEDGLTRSAVYCDKIASAYYDMGWYREAHHAYKKVENFWNKLGKTDSALGPNRTANRLKKELNVYTKVSVEQKNNLEKHEPLSGMYFGACFDKDPKIENNLKKVEKAYGKKHTAFLMYLRREDSIQKGTTNQAEELGAALQISWEPPADMNDVKYERILDFANQLKGLDMPVF